MQTATRPHPSINATVSLFIIGITVFYANNTGFSVLSLGKQFEIASSNEEKAMLLAACKTMITQFDVAAFMISYVIVSLSWTIISIAMAGSTCFNRKTAVAGIHAGISGIIAEIIENTLRELRITTVFRDPHKKNREYRRDVVTRT